MASSNRSSANGYRQTRNLCRYFLSNTCHFGDDCFYSHDQSNSVARNPCQYFLRGRCAYGDLCRYEHIEPATESLRVSPLTPRANSSEGNSEDEISQSFRENSNRATHVLSSSAIESRQLQNNSSIISRTQRSRNISNGNSEILESRNFCTEEKQREEHCLKYPQERELKYAEANAIENNENTKCGICLEIVSEKTKDKRFGILENCSHVFCLDCIRKWRSMENYDNRVIKACPECRKTSNFVMPSLYWPDNSESKRNMIRTYKNNLQHIHCKFFERGDGQCPFGSKCFYLHVNKHGNRVRLSPPRARRGFSTNEDIENYSDGLMGDPVFSSMVNEIFEDYYNIMDSEGCEENEQDDYYTNDY